MGTILPTATSGSGKRTLVETTLTASDTFAYRTGQILCLRNPTAGALTPVIDGAGGTTVPVTGVGSVDVSAGYSVGSIAAGAAVAIPLDSIKAYLRGTIAVTGGTGLIATLIG